MPHDLAQTFHDLFASVGKTHSVNEQLYAAIFFAIAITVWAFWARLTFRSIGEPDFDADLPPWPMAQAEGLGGGNTETLRDSNDPAVIQLSHRDRGLSA